MMRKGRMSVLVALAICAAYRRHRRKAESDDALKRDVERRFEVLPLRDGVALRPEAATVPSAFDGDRRRARLPIDGAAGHRRRTSHASRRRCRPRCCSCPTCPMARAARSFRCRARRRGSFTSTSCRSSRHPAGVRRSRLRRRLRRDRGVRGRTTGTAIACASAATSQSTTVRSSTATSSRSAGRCRSTAKFRATSSRLAAASRSVRPLWSTETSPWLAGRCTAILEHRCAGKAQEVSLGWNRLRPVDVETEPGGPVVALDARLGVRVRRYAGPRGGAVPASPRSSCCSDATTWSALSTDGCRHRREGRRGRSARAGPLPAAPGDHLRRARHDHRRHPAAAAIAVRHSRDCRRRVGRIYGGGVPCRRTGGAPARAGPTRTRIVTTVTGVLLADAAGDAGAAR